MAAPVKNQSWDAVDKVVHGTQARPELVSSAQGEEDTGVSMTYSLQFLHDDGSPACFYMTQCVSDAHAKAIAKSVLNLQYSGVEILRGEKLIYQELKSGKPN